MKKLFAFLTVVIVVIACSKDDNSPRTFATVTNATPILIKGVKVGYMNGAEGRVRLLKDVGELLAGGSSKFQVTNDTVTSVLLYLDADSKSYMVTDPYPIIKNVENSLIISPTTDAVEVDRSSTLYPQ
ncbi:MAG: hypothetical protein JNK79_01445 [Chitinophagaceae bacterium]|nr:hypothetical protein [Chitinophagaceae bacterium]